MAHTFDDNIVSDLYKDAFGCRPSRYFWESWNAASDDVKQQIWDRLLADLDNTMRLDEEREQAAIKTFEGKVQSLITCGAKNREVALRWLMEASECAGDWEYFCFKHGLPYGYFNKVEV